MDEKLKSIIYWVILIISTIVLIISTIGNYLIVESKKEDFIAVDRSPLHPFRLVDYKETSDGIFIDVVSTINGKKYENNFVSKVCPARKYKNIGMIMNLSVVENIKTATQETFYTLDRAYEYLCTNLDMKQEDEKLFQRIKEARDRMAKENGVVVIKGNQQQQQE